MLKKWHVFFQFFNFLRKEIKHISIFGHIFGAPDFQMPKKRLIGLAFDSTHNHALRASSFSHGLDFGHDRASFSRWTSPSLFLWLNLHSLIDFSHTRGKQISKFNVGTLFIDKLSRLFVSTIGSLPADFTDAEMPNDGNKFIVQLYFTQSTDSNNKWKCKCGKEITQKKNTGWTNLFNHVKSQHPEYTERERHLKPTGRMTEAILT